MRIILDHCVNADLAPFLTGHEVSTAASQGWENLSNGKFLDAAEQAGFEVLVTTDKNLRFQQNISKRKLVLVTLSPLFTAIDDLLELVPDTLKALDQPPRPGTSVVIEPSQSDV